jgi:hypothetical protein
LKIKDFFKRVVSKGEHHMMVWVVVFANLDEPISLSKIGQKVRISKTHVFRIIQWGIDVLKELEVECQYSSDSNGITVSVGKAAVKTKEISKVAQETKSMPTAKNTETTIQIILYLNEKANKNFSVEAKEAKRPITLFGTKFNSYLNERPQNEQITNQSNIARTIAVANKVASELSGMDSE